MLNMSYSTYVWNHSMVTIWCPCSDSFKQVVFTPPNKNKTPIQRVSNIQISKFCSIACLVIPKWKCSCQSADEFSRPCLGKKRLHHPAESSSVRHTGKVIVWYRASGPAWSRLERWFQVPDRVHLHEKYLAWLWPERLSASFSNLLESTESLYEFYKLP